MHTHSCTSLRLLAHMLSLARARRLHVVGDAVDCLHAYAAGSTGEEMGVMLCMLLAWR